MGRQSKRSSGVMTVAVLAAAAVPLLTPHIRLRRRDLAGTTSAEGGALYPDEAERERALRYNRAQHWLTLAGIIWGAAINVVALASGFSARLRDGALRVAPRQLGPAMPYTFVGAILANLVSLPLTYWGGYALERRYGLTNQGRGAWFGEQLKGVGVALALSLPLVQGVYWVIRRSPRWWWAILSGLAVPFTIVLTNLAPVLILPLFNRFEPLKDRALAERIKALAAAQGVTVSDVLQMDMSRQTKKAKEFWTQ